MSSDGVLGRPPGHGDRKPAVTLTGTPGHSDRQKYPHEVPPENSPQVHRGREGGAFLERLHGSAEGWVACLTRREAEGRRLDRPTEWLRPRELPEFAVRAVPDRHVWVSVCSFAKKSRTASSAVCAPGLWADLDPREEPLAAWRQSALSRLSEFAPAPSLIVDSGRGFHGYWLFDAVLRLDLPKRELVARLNRAIEVALDGDSVGDPSRVMRLPGTRNPKEGGGWARVLQWDGPTYRLEDLEARLAPFTARLELALPPAPKPAQDRTERTPTVEVIRRKPGRPRLAVNVHDLRSLAPWARDLIVGGRWRFPRRYASRSEADLAAVGAMVRSGWADEKIQAAFGREEWFIGARFRHLQQREGQGRAANYVQRTIRRARHGAKTLKARDELLAAIRDGDVEALPGWVGICAEGQTLAQLSAGEPAAEPSLKLARRGRE